MGDRSMIKISIIGLCALLVANFFILSACGQDGNVSRHVAGKEIMSPSPYPEPRLNVGGNDVMSPSEPKSIIDALKEKAVFDDFLLDINETGLGTILTDNGPLTIFAPNDFAFDQLEDSSKEKLSNDKESLTNVLKYHIVSGNFTIDDMAKVKSLKTLQGEYLQLSSDSTGHLKINGGETISSETVCTNGIVYIIDKLLVPEDLRNQIKEKATEGNSEPTSGHLGADTVTGNAMPEEMTSQMNNRQE